MQLAHIEIGSDLQELTKHGSKAFPFQTYLDDMSFILCRKHSLALAPGV